MFSCFSFFLHMCTCLSMCICTKWVQEPEEVRRGSGSHGSGVTDGCELWEMNLRPLGVQQVLLTTEAPLQHPLVDFLYIFGGSREVKTFYIANMHQVPLQSNQCHAFPMIWDHKKFKHHLYSYSFSPV